MDTYDKQIKSMTCIEYNPHFVELGRKLLPKVNWIHGNAYDQQLLDKLVENLPDKKFDLMISNPPFGVDMNKGNYSWLNYQGHRDLMALEICLRYGRMECLYFQLVQFLFSTQAKGLMMINQNVIPKS
jgi:predicted RNA methylase